MAKNTKIALITVSLLAIGGIGFFMWWRKNKPIKTYEDAMKHLISKGLDENFLKGGNKEYILTWAKASKDKQPTFLWGNTYRNTSDGTVAKK